MGVDFQLHVFDRRIADTVLSYANGAVSSQQRFYWVYDGANAILQYALNASTNQVELQSQKLFGAQVDELLAVDVLSPNDEVCGNDVTVWPLADRQGTVRDLAKLDPSSGVASVFAHYKYDAFGKLITDSTTSLYSVAIGAAYTGREFDPATGLYFYRARFYDAANGLFISEDPLGLQVDSNPYRYTCNSPTNFTDPSGMVVETIWDIGSIGVGVGSAGYNTYRIATTGEGWKDLGFDLLGLGADVVAAFVPFVPGGASVAIKSGRAFQATNTARGAARFIQRADTLANAYQTYEAYQEGNMLGVALGGVHFGIRYAQVVPDLVRLQQRQMRQGMLLSDVTGGIVGRKVIAPATVNSFNSFGALKRALGPAGEGKVWHHIVEQRATNATRFGAEGIHNTSNVVAISREANQAIANYYSSIRPFSNGLPVRQWLGTQTFPEQSSFGNRIMNHVLSGQTLP